MLRGGSRVEQEVTLEFAWRRALLRNDVTAGHGSSAIRLRLRLCVRFSGVRGPGRLGITVQELSS